MSHNKRTIDSKIQRPKDLGGELIISLSGSDCIASSLWGCHTMSEQPVPEPEPKD